MATKTEARRTGDYLISEANGTRSRENIVIVSGAGTLQPGTVLGRVTASGKYNVYDPDDTDGGGTGLATARAVLYAAVDATDGDAPAVAHVRDCEVTEARLIGVDSDAIDDLAEAGVIVR